MQPNEPRAGRACKRRGARMVCGKREARRRRRCSSTSRPRGCSAGRQTGGAGGASPACGSSSAPAGISRPRSRRAAAGVQGKPSAHGDTQARPHWGLLLSIWSGAAPGRPACMQQGACAASEERMRRQVECAARAGCCPTPPCLLPGWCAFAAARHPAGRARTRSNASEHILVVGRGRAADAQTVRLLQPAAKACDELAWGHVVAGVRRGLMKW